MSVRLQKSDARKYIAAAYEFAEQLRKEQLARIENDLDNGGQALICSQDIIAIERTKEAVLAAAEEVATTMWTYR